MSREEYDARVYPYTEPDGSEWVDPSGLLGDGSHCFMCKRPTRRIDIDYHGYFCNSYACDMAIDFDMRGKNDVRYATSTEWDELYRRFRGGMDRS